MRRVNTRLFWIALLACLTTACDGQGGPARADAGVAALPDTTAHGQPVDNPPALGEDTLAQDWARLPNNSEQMFKELPAGDRELVENFYRNYGASVMAFANKKELLWLMRHGYPLPEHVLEAASQSEQHLQTRYEGGDVMAGYFLLDRKAAAFVDQKPDFSSYLDAESLAEELLIRGGPFSGYAYHRYKSQLKDSRHKALAGLLWADWQGDYRAGNDLMDLTGRGARHRGEELPDPASVAFAYQTLLSGIRARNPGALGRRIDPLLKYKNDPGAP